MDIVLIPPGGLRNVWERVREGLDKMPAEDWIAEDVYHAIKSGESSLHVGIDGGEYAGFMVLRKNVTEFSRQPVLHVWLVYSHGSSDIFTSGEQLLRDTARNMGAKKITFGSPRIGWSKRYPLVNVNYEVPMEIT